MQFRGVDARGRVYREDRDLRRLLASGSGEGVDSIAVVRHALDATGDDTVGVLTERRRATTSQQPAEAGVRRITIANAAPNPVSPRDQWAVFRDGRVVLLRAESYRPEIWSANGQRRLAAPIPHRRIPVTDAVKEAVETQRLALLQHATVMRFGASSDGGPSTSSSGLPAGVRLPPLTDWPDILPAFRPSANALWPLPSGALWVERLDPLDSRGTVFDVLTSDGALSHKVRVPAGLTVVGFGPRSVYTVRHDEDGLAYLQRHPLPGRTG
jgi:hypothetical protein